MLGKNVLWVAKQHGHSTMTMLRAYAAWTEGALEADIQAIERSMQLTPRRAPLARGAAPCRYGRRAAMRELLDLKSLAVDQSVAKTSTEFGAPASKINTASAGNASHCFVSENETDEKLAGVPGFEPGNGGIKTRCPIESSSY
jgi:hypothetical protein